MILYTSGTTGRPKGAMLAHCNIIHSAMIYRSFCMELTSKDRSIAAGPLAHVTGVVANIMSMVRLRRHADHRRGVQGGGLSQGRRARARHPDGDGAGDV